MSERPLASSDRPRASHDPPGGLDDGRPEPSPAGPFHRLVTAPMVRRLSPRKLLIGLGLASAAVAALGVLGGHLVREAMRWLHDQPAYRLPFAEIALDPPPPPWIRSGTDGLLEQVRTCSEWRDQAELRVLDVALGELAVAFRRCSPWVRDVLGIEREYPNRLTVRLDYREPVARLTLGRGEVRRDIFLDGDGVVLPADDLDIAAAGPLALLELPLAAGATLLERPGRVLAAAPTDPATAPDPMARDACRLAAFLKSKNAVVGPGTNRSPLLVNYIRQNDYGLWIQTDELALIHWQVPPGREDPGAMTAEEKWAALQDWLNRHRLDAVEYPRYLAFEGDRVVILRGREAS